MIYFAFFNLNMVSNSIHRSSAQSYLEVHGAEGRCQSTESPCGAPHDGRSEEPCAACPLSAEDRAQVRPALCAAGVAEADKERVRLRPGGSQHGLGSPPTLPTCTGPVRAAVPLQLEAGARHDLRGGHQPWKAGGVQNGHQIHAHLDEEDSR